MASQANVTTNHLRSRKQRAPLELTRPQILWEQGGASSSPEWREMAHEIKNALSCAFAHLESIRGRLEAKDEGTGTADALEGVDVHVSGIMRALHHASALLVEDRCDPSRATRFDDAVASAVEMSSAQAPRLGSLTTDMGAPGALIPDPVAVIQVVLNLVINAGEASAREERPRVHVRTYMRGAWCCVAVEDNGPGFSTRRTAGEWSLSTKGPGRGLGLRVSRRIARQLGGDLTILPRTGGGTIIELRVPPTATR